MKTYASFQNSMKGVINLYQGFSKGNLTFQFAIATNPKKPNEIQKGDKIYDYQNARWFALDEREALQILLWLQQIASGNTQQDKVEIKHYPEGALTVLTVGYNAQNQSFYISFSEIRNKQQVFNLALGLDQLGILQLKNFLETYPLVKTFAAYHDYASWKQSSGSNGNYTSRTNGAANTPNQTTPATTNTNNNNPAPAGPVPGSNPLSFLS